MFGSSTRSNKWKKKEKRWANDWIRISYQLMNWLPIRPDDVIVLVAYSNDDVAVVVVVDARLQLVNVNDGSLPFPMWSNKLPTKLDDAAYWTMRLVLNTKCSLDMKNWFGILLMRSFITLNMRQDWRFVGGRVGQASTQNKI